MKNYFKGAVHRANNICKRPITTSGHPLSIDAGNGVLWSVNIITRNHVILYEKKGSVRKRRTNNDYKLIYQPVIRSTYTPGPFGASGQEQRLNASDVEGESRRDRPRCVIVCMIYRRVTKRLVCERFVSLKKDNRPWLGIN